VIGFSPAGGLKMDERRIVVPFWEAVTLGFGFAIGTLIAYFTIAVAVGIAYGIMLLVQGD
jgi:hypothetical protein